VALLKYLKDLTRETVISAEEEQIRHQGPLAELIWSRCFKRITTPAQTLMNVRGEPNTPSGPWRSGTKRISADNRAHLGRCSCLGISIEPRAPHENVRDDKTYKRGSGRFLVELNQEMTVELEEYARKPRPMKVIVIGAGIAGIAFTYLAKRMEEMEFVIYEKNPEVGGTWYEHRFPGLSCDVPGHCYTYSWQGNPNWSQVYARGEEIFSFYRGLAEDYGVYEKTKFEHKVTGARWMSETGQWEVTVENLKTGETIVDAGNVLLNCGGVLNNWNFPDIKGLNDKFQGPVIHPARWDDSVSLKDKNVAVIGSGASALQIVPAIHPEVKHLSNFNRSPNWVIPEFLSEFAADDRPTKYSEEEKKRLREDPEYFRETRKRYETAANSTFGLFVKDSPIHKQAAEYTLHIMRERLGFDEELCKTLIPQIPVGCRRPTPGHNYLETLTKSNVDVVTSPIKEVTETNIQTEDGKTHPADIIITATGYDTSYVPRFPLVGSDGVDLRERWAESDPEAYMGVCVPNYPNYFTSGGPGSPITNGSYVIGIEHQVNFCLQFVRKMQTEGIKSVKPKTDITTKLNEQLETMMQKLSLSGPCHSWYKSRRTGKVIAPWPGSAPHYMETVETPRYEDFDYEYQSSNPFEFLANGYSYREGKNLPLDWYVK
jgi:cation diffusion facilitator CzcD-associated flavoprotein CzcO